MTDFSFLDNVELSEVSPSAARVSRKAPSNPTNADIRLFKSGAVYPSLALIEEFNLEYQPEGSTEVENGIDLIDSDIWKMIPIGTPQFLAIAIVSKGEARKPHIFGKSRKDVEGNPINKVAEQGSTSSGKELEFALINVLGFAWAEGQAYVDLQIDREHLIASPNGVYLLPRLQTKGNDVGKVLTVRRENCAIYPISIIGGVAQEEMILEEEPQMEADPQEREAPEPATEENNEETQDMINDQFAEEENPAEEEVQ